MEPKLLQGSIKEEAPERPPQQPPSPAAHKARSSPPASEAARPTRASSKGSTKEAPDSPEGAQQAPSVPIAGATILSTPTGSESSTSKNSPPAMGVVNGSNRDFPSSPPASLNGSGGSPSPPGAAPIAVPMSSGSASQAQLLEARQLAKMRRFLTTIVQFGSDISPETGERVKSLVLALVSNTLGVEEFQRALQAAFNFPLRPFVLPFLRAGIPAMQREVAALARIAKQSPQQYLRQHEQLVMDPSFSPSEPSEIFHSMGEHHAEPAFALKRPRESLYENGVGDSEYAPATKRYLSYSSGQSSTSFFSSHPHHMMLHPTGHSSDLGGRASVLGVTHPPSTSAHYNPFLTGAAASQSSGAADESRGRCGDDEWKNIHVMLNCILSMVEKTKRALGILQQRPQPESSSAEFTSSWLRKLPTDSSEQSDIKKAAGDIMAQTIKLTEERVAEVKRRAEEAVNEVKRQAMLELHRAVTAAETKAAELVATERLRMEKLLLEARKHAEEAPSTSEAGSEISGNCWNCGRKANETCSGCNTARYCGAFCQHKDWENHHQACSITAEKNASAPKSTASLKVATVSLTATAAEGK
ncbi:protein CBFA2T3 [Neocloeon triangulifer]|uniref:protein CBFA2T3 n=1 Tax=Neocloeon triangulifer TaxID=2078957 RepID=UPI00286ECFEA|nr:protein CBFA2T3 [Neocloeon triangulifer]